MEDSGQSLPIDWTAFVIFIFGKYWRVLRALLLPLLFLLRPWFGGPYDIHYAADIGPGLKILHPTLGVVISRYTIAGKKLMLVGGNCIGRQNEMKQGDIRIGDGVILGANAVIIGPITVGNNVMVGAGAVVVKDAESGSTLVGVPATPIIYT